MALLSWKTIPTLGLLAGLGWLAASPYLALASLRDAVRERDAPAISARVDFPALRTSLKDNVRVVLAQKMDSRDPAAALGMAFAGPFIDAQIDKAITPDGLASFMATAARGDARTASTPASAGATEDDVPTDWSVARTGITTFDFTITGNHPAAGSIGHFEMQGIQWKLTGITLSPEAIAGFAPS